MPSVPTQTSAETTAPLRIVMVAHSHWLGGMEQSVVTLSKALQAQGHMVGYAGPVDGWLGTELASIGVTCCHVPLNGMYDVISFFKLYGFVKRFKPDIVHGHSQRGGRYAAWVAGWAKVPAVATAHSTTSSKWFKKARIHVIAVSDAVKRFLLSQGLPDEQVSMVHLGVHDVDKWSVPSGGEITPDRPLRLGMVSRVTHLKGHDIALRAMAHLNPKIPCTLTIVGDYDGDWGRHMKQHAQRLGLADKVDFLGQQRDIVQLMAGFDLLLAPSRREALSLTLIEAAAAGRAVVASNIGGIPEVVLHEKTGLLFPSEDWLAMAEAIERLSAPDVRIAYGMAARDYYEHEFTIDHMREKTESVYRKLIAENQKTKSLK